MILQKAAYPHLSPPGPFTFDPNKKAKREINQ